MSSWRGSPLTLPRPPKPTGQVITESSDAIKTKQTSIAKLEASIASVRAAKPAISELEHVRGLLATLQGADDQARIGTRAKIATALPGIVRAVTFTANGSFHIKLVADARFTLDNSKNRNGWKKPSAIFDRLLDRLKIRERIIAAPVLLDAYNNNHNL